MRQIEQLLKACLQCKNPTCTQGCPAHNDIKEFIRLAKENKIDEAYEVIKKTSTLSSICSLVCPFEKQCEKHCIKSKTNNPVSIHEIEHYVSTHAEDKIPSIELNGKRVAVIGSGPASLACAETLANLGYSIDIYEKYHEAGGILTFGIPDFVLDKEIVSKKIQYLEELGVKFLFNKEYKKDISLEQLKDNYDAIFLAFGASTPKFMNIEGEDKEGVIDANEFLEKIHSNSIEYCNVKNVIVVGGGNTAIDAARAAKRYFKDSAVAIVYRRSENEMPARKDEYIKALDDGIKFNFLTNPIKYHGNANVNSIECIKMELGEVKDGRAIPVEIPNSNFIIDADLVILAISSSVDKNLIEPLETNKWGCVQVNEINQTSDPMVFAGGDCINGPSTVVQAMVDGIRSANSINKYLQDKIKI